MTVKPEVSLGTDLLPLLRQRKARGHYASIYGDAIDWAADEIERLRAELEDAKADIAMLIQKEVDAING